MSTGIMSFARSGGIQRGPGDNGGCFTLLIIIGLMILFRACIG